MSFPLSADEIIQIISVVAIAAVAIPSAILAAKYTEKYRDQNENAVEHFKQIKARVLTQMLKQIDQYYLPTLEFRMEGLQWDRRDKVKFAVDLGEQPITYEVVASAATPGNSRSIRTVGEENIDIEAELYQDALKNHFHTALEHWHKLTSNVNEYNQECLALANSITESIAKKLNLPIIGAWDLPTEYVTPYCGVAIFNRMAGTQGYQLSVDIPNPATGQRPKISFGNPIIYLPLGSDPNIATEIVAAEIKERRDRFLQLKAKAEALDKEFASLRVQIVMLTEKQKLSGRCDYI
jgi:hypothetical protein